MSTNKGKGTDERGWPREKLTYITSPRKRLPGGAKYSPSGEGARYPQPRDKAGRFASFEQKMPNIYCAGKAQHINNWTSLDAQRCRAAMGKSTLDGSTSCLVCGLPCEGFYVMMRLFEAPAPAYPRWCGRIELTDGPGGHPRCMWLARNVCPHLANYTHPARTVAYVWALPGCGIEAYSDKAMRSVVRPRAVPINTYELKSLAKQSPLGDLPWAEPAGR